MIKRKLRLVKDKDIKKVYEIVTVFLVDDSIHTFNLDEWDFVTSDREWLQFIKIDDSAMECFYISNIVRVSFNRNRKEVKTDYSSTPMKPVA